MTIRVTFDLLLPEGSEPEDITEWLKFYLGANGSMRADNPLEATTTLEARNVDWEER